MHALDRAAPAEKVVVVGGGISGLAAAEALVAAAAGRGGPASEDKGPRPSRSLTLLESSGRLGGVLSTHREGPFLLEEGPDSLIRSKPAALELCERLGVTVQDTELRHARSMVVHKGRLVAIPFGFRLVAPTALWPMLRTPLFSLPGKLRMAMDLLLPARPEGSGPDDESLASFVRRRLGDEALTRLIQPLIAGIYSGDAESLSIQATFPQLLDLEREHRSLILGMRAAARRDASARPAAGARYGLFVTPREGMGALVDALRSRLQGVELRLGTEASTLERRETGWVVHTTGGASLDADAVILAVPPSRAARLLAPVEPGLSQRLDAIRFASATTINLIWSAAEFPHPLDAFGFVVPPSEERFLLACTFSSRKYAGRCGPEHHLLRAFVSGEEACSLDDETLLEGVLRDLRDLLGVVEPPHLSRIRRHPGSLPQYRLGHLERISEIEGRVESLPGLALAGNAYRGVGVSDCILSGQAAAARVLARTCKGTLSTLARTHQ